MTWSRRGVTLIELLVVLALMGILSAAVSPALLQDPVEREPARSAGEVATLLNSARRSALARAVPVTVTLIPETGQAWLAEGRDAPVERWLELAPGVRLRATADRVQWTMHPYGRTDGRPILVEGFGTTLLVGADEWTGKVYVRP